MRLLGKILVVGARLALILVLGLILVAGYIQDIIDGKRDRH
jgi:hypothetical protein